MALGSKKIPEDGKHSVKDGEWVGSIAMLYGYTEWDERIWQLSENDALREKRADPKVLGKDDELFIPEMEQREESGETEQEHKFKLNAPTETLRMRVLDEDGAPLPDEEYQLEIEALPGGGTFVQSGTQTDGESTLTETIPSTAVKGKLIMPRLELEIPLRLGYLTPMDPDDPEKLFKGAHQRLAALDFYHGPIDGQETGETSAAVRRFQQFCKDNLGKDDSIMDAGEVNGELNEETQEALHKYFGC